MTPAQMQASTAARVTLGATTILAGWSQVSADNQDAFVARLDGEALAWCVAAESSGPDGRAHGLVFDGAERLYVAYTVVGGGTEFDGKGGWMPAYGSAGSGGNKVVTVIARHDPMTGALVSTTFVPSQLESAKKVNSLFPRALTLLVDGGVELLAEPAFSPLNPDGSRMCVGGSEYPRGYRAIFEPDLSALRCAMTEGCSKVAKPCLP